MLHWNLIICIHCFLLLVCIWVVIKHLDEMFYTLTFDSWINMYYYSWWVRSPSRFPGFPGNLRWFFGRIFKQFLFQLTSCTTCQWKLNRPITWWKLCTFYTFSWRTVPAVFIQNFFVCKYITFWPVYLTLIKYTKLWISSTSNWTRWAICTATICLLKDCHSNKATLRSNFEI